MPHRDGVQYNLRLPQSVSDRLHQVTLKPGVTRAAIVVEAVEQWLDRCGDDALELRFAHRLDRHTNHLMRLENLQRITAESLGLFIRYMLSVNPPPADGDAAARALGRDRFAAFVERVGQQLAKGKLSLVPEDEDSDK